MKELHKNSPILQDFQKASGCPGSLQYPISQLKAALSYPQGGLPVILQGEKGCGKSYLVRLTHEFCLNRMTSLQKELPLVKKKAFRDENKGRQMEELFGMGAVSYTHLFTWSSICVIGILEKIDVRYTMFSPSGIPVRGEVSISIAGEYYGEQLQTVNPSEQSELCVHTSFLDDLRDYKDSENWKNLAQQNDCLLYTS